MLHELDQICGNTKTVRVIDGSASKWDRIALRLHFRSSMISQIRMDCQTNAFRACQSVFSQWLDGKEGLRTPRTWGTVIDALKEADYGQLAEDLKEAIVGNAKCSILIILAVYTTHIMQPRAHQLVQTQLKI